MKDFMFNWKSLPMKAIIVDDEPGAIELLKSYLEKFPDIEIAGTFRNALKAFEFIGANKVDLVFLDINMPYLTGLSFSRVIDRETKIIFTTAYAEYAAESYEVEAVDYLLKPISFERFARAVTKALKSTGVSKEANRDSLMIKSGSRIYRLDPVDIQYLKKDGNYMVYFTNGRKIMARESVTEALNVLPDYFVQVHKSFIVNIKKIDTYGRDEISIREETIPVSASFKEIFIQKMQGMGLVGFTGLT